jgi:outer membrane protein TolC
MVFQQGKSGKRLWRVSTLAFSALVLAAMLHGESSGQETKRAGLSLQDCVDLGLQNQPALAAARASLDAAQSAYSSLQNLRLIGRLSKQMPIRREQACWGITIADAGLQQAEWETRYAVTRNYFSAIHARNQEAVAKSVLLKLTENREKAYKIVEAGDPKSKLTQIDVDNLDLQIAFLQARMTEATIGKQRALSALREAIGVDKDYPLVLNTQARLPDPVYKLDRDKLIAMGLERRGEMVQASGAEQVTALEIDAQRRSHKLQVDTFSRGGDIHSKPIPQGVSNGEYRPGAIGPEMPATLYGHKGDRVERAEAFNDRAGAVVDKTQKLITLEVDATFQKWQESIEKIQFLNSKIALAKKIADNVTRRFNDNKATGEEMIKARTLEDQAQNLYNEALYNHALALAALERVTAGGYRPTYAAKRQP